MYTGAAPGEPSPPSHIVPALLPVLSQSSKAKMLVTPAPITAGMYPVVPETAFPDGPRPRMPW